jgi:hypothetical protein
MTYLVRGAQVDTFPAQFAQPTCLVANGTLASTGAVGSQVSKYSMARKKRSRFLTTAEAAEFLRLKKHTLENMRCEEIGPPHRKHGGRVFYHLDDLIAWSKSTRRKK